MSQAEDGSEANGRKLLTEAKFIKWSEKRSSKRGNSAMTGETWKVEEDNHFADEFASQEALSAALTGWFGVRDEVRILMPQNLEGLDKANQVFLDGRGHRRDLVHVVPEPCYYRACLQSAALTEFGGLTRRTRSFSTGVAVEETSCMSSPSLASTGLARRARRCPWWWWWWERSWSQVTSDPKQKTQGFWLGLRLAQALFQSLRAAQFKVEESIADNTINIRQLIYDEE
ncbi:hypothetical protein C8F04DRAFT_1173064 [Mycena alexandri]|uniref:Uncharacterized protein n=1 Tax=Mycena alexandri TaxID=1745969 RepID=A0AAD6XDL6_9AGAR|nr:hypothetical protein C8F04DRAFT_1173064 [Mycena alexandri]